MLEKMYDEKGIGIEEIKVGEKIRMIVIEIEKEGEKKEKNILVNKKIVK